MKVEESLKLVKKVQKHIITHSEIIKKLVNNQIEVREEIVKLQEGVQKTETKIYDKIDKVMKMIMKTLNLSEKVGKK